MNSLGFFRLLFFGLIYYLFFYFSLFLSKKLIKKNLSMAGSREKQCIKIKKFRMFIQWFV